MNQLTNFDEYAAGVWAVVIFNGCMVSHAIGEAIR